LLLLLSACAAPTQTTQKRFLWPIGHPQPKIEYVTFYATDQDVKHRESDFAQAILGIEPGVPLFASPRGIAVEQQRFAVADMGKRRVLIADLQAGEVRSLQDRDDNSFQFPMPMGVTFDDRGGGYVSDTSTGSIYRFNAAEQVTAAFGKGELNRPNGMVFDPVSQQLFVADTLNHQIAVYRADGKPVKRFGRKGSAPGEFNFPLDVDLGPNGELVVLDSLNSRVQILHKDGRFLRMFGERGTALGSFMLPKALAVDGFGHVYVSDSRAHRFVIFDLQGNYLLTIGSRSVLVGGAIHPGGFDFPQGIAADKNGVILVVDALSKLVHRFQFLSDAYLQQHPIEVNDIYVPADSR
jgi:DNA-binding beta-propeller fold protein YncE